MENQIKKLQVSCLVFLVSYLGACTTLPLEIKYKPFADISYSKRASPARIYDGKLADLLSSDFLLIGYIDVRRNIRKCYEDNTCKAVTDEMPIEKDVLIAAAERGGDLVILLEDKDISEGISKSICTSTSVNTMTVNGIVQVYTVCNSYLKIPGRLESKISRALIWRRDPVNAGVEANTRAVRVAMQTLDEEFSIINRKINDKSNELMKSSLARLPEEAKDEGNLSAEKLRTLIRKAGDGDRIAQNNVGHAFSTGMGAKKDARLAFQWFMQAAEGGYPVAQSNVALMYYHGTGVQQSFAGAFKWYEKSASAGYRSAQFGLCLLYSHGRGVQQDDKNAFEWCSRAKDKGHLDATVNLGFMHVEGRGTKTDVKKGIKLYRIAAKKGNSFAQYNLGLLYLKGDHLKKDAGKAFELIKKSAEQENPHAQYQLGVMYEKGIAVNKDIKVARRWYQRAEKNKGSNAIVRSRDRLSTEDSL